MSLKTRVQATTIALVVVGALSYYYFGRGGKLDTSQDRDIILNVVVSARRLYAANYSVYINDAHKETESIYGDSWTDHMWIRPGERVRLEGSAHIKGSITCSIMDQGKVHTQTSPVASDWEQVGCSVTVVG